MTAVRRYLPASIIVLLFGSACIPYWPFKVDDAYISFVYARNWVQGQGLTYNGLNVEGYSNFLWTVLIAGFLKLGADPMLAARGLSLFLGAIGLVTLQKLQTHFNPALGQGNATLATLSVGLSAPFLAWTVGGLETVFLASLIILTIYTEVMGGFYARYVSPILVLAAALTRPEGVMLIPIWLTYRWWQQPRAIAAWSGLALFFIITYGLFIWRRYETYGYLLPNTAYLKLDPNTHTAWLAAEWLLDYLRLRPIFALLLVGGVMALVRQWRSIEPHWQLVTVIILAFVGFVLYSGRDWMPHHRFLTPIVPLFGLLIGKILAAPKDQRIRLALQILTVISILFEIGLSVSLYRSLTIDLGRYTDELVRAGHWIRATTPSDAIIAVEDAGAIAYYGERPTIDVLGLNDTQIAHSPRKSDPAYVLSQEPGIIQLHAAFSPTGALVGPIKQKATQDIVSHPGFKACYIPDTHRPADPYYPYLFFRRCSSGR